MSRFPHPITFVAAGLLALAVAGGAAAPARAELPPTETLLTDLGLSAAAIADAKAGKIVTRKVAAAHERDLASSFAFFVPVAPAAFVEQLRSGLLTQVDPATISRGSIAGAASLADFAKLALTPDGAARAKRYTAPDAAESLNLSAEEQAAFAKLGAGASVAAVEAQVRAALLARVQAYRAKGLDGIAPYLRESGGTRDVGGDLRASLESVSGLRKHAPNAYAAMAGYPRSLPAGSEDRFSWVQLKAHGLPTLVLNQGLIVPDGEAFIAMQRQFYVSEGFNSEQAIAGILPTEGGSIVLYVNHTSTDQVAGFGGGAKRSIGSKLMASQLQDIFKKMQKAKP